jgi:hypothetical protein
MGWLARFFNSPICRSEGGHAPRPPVARDADVRLRCTPLAPWRCLAARTPSASRTSRRSQGVRPNQLVGYGIVVGLDGTGDQTSQAPFTVQSIKNMLAASASRCRPTSTRS